MHKQEKYNREFLLDSRESTKQEKQSNWTQNLREYQIEDSLN